MKNSIGLLAAGGVLVVGALPIYSVRELSFLDVWLSLWTILFVVGFVLIALEGAFFMETPEVRRLSQFVVAFLVTGAVAAGAAGVVSTGGLDFTLGDNCRALWRARSWEVWGLRLFGVAGLFTAAYCTIGSATWPFVRGYYEDPVHGLALRVPGGRVILALQMVRGSLTTLALVPLIACIPARNMAWVARMALLLAMSMAIAPLVLSAKWPMRLRCIHALEISIFAVAYSFILWWLVALPAGPG